MLVLLLTLFSVGAHGQTSGKEVTEHVQSWYSINNTFRFSGRWGMVTDYHVRRDNFMKDDYFYFLRIGAIYWVADRYPVIAGVAHLWLAPPPGNSTWSNENRIYEQWSAVTRQHRAIVLNRIRLEQRWRDNIVNDEVVGPKQFTTRLRYLVSFERPVFKNPKMPSPVISDEVLVQFGPSIQYNTFDQNRLFLDLKVPLNTKLSFDIGYMNIWQQRPTGYQYDMSHVFRLFFYYNVDFSGTKHVTDPMGDAE